MKAAQLLGGFVCWKTSAMGAGGLRFPLRVVPEFQTGYVLQRQRKGALLETTAESRAVSQSE